MKKIDLNKGLLKQKYLKEKKSSYQIAKELNISQATVHRRLQELKIKCRSYGAHSILQNINLSNTPTLSYILGVLKGDGYVTLGKIGHYRIHLLSIDKIFVEEFKYSLEKIGINPSIRPLHNHLKNKNWSQQWLCTAYSKKFYYWYKNLKLEDLIKIVNKKRENKIQFIKAFYESEGTFVKRKSGQQIHIYNTDLNLIKFTKNMAHELGYDFSLTSRKTNPKWKTLYTLALYKREEIKSFLKLLKPCIYRKSWDSYEDFIKI